MCLLAVPWTSIWCAQRSHDLDKTFETLANRFSHARHATIRGFTSMTDETHSGTSAESSSVTFIGFVLSLAHTAAVHFGDVPDPVTGQPAPVNLPAAQQIIDILALMQDKTRGNLTAEERRLLDDVLYDLRMRFLESANSEQSGSGQSRIILP